MRWEATRQDKRRYHTVRSENGCASYVRLERRRKSDRSDCCPRFCAPSRLRRASQGRDIASLDRAQEGPTTAQSRYGPARSAQLATTAGRGYGLVSRARRYDEFARRPFQHSGKEDGARCIARGNLVLRFNHRLLIGATQLLVAPIALFALCAWMRRVVNGGEMLEIKVGIDLG